MLARTAVCGAFTRSFPAFWAGALEVDMMLKKAIAGMGWSTLLLIACSGPTHTVGTKVDFADSRIEADSYVAAPAVETTAVAGYESPGPASLSSVQTEPAPGPTWELAEGHMTIVGYAEQ
jgi:hypothetical protein